MELKRGDDIVAGLIRPAVEPEGCRLADLDLEKSIVRIEGSNDIIGNCAQAVDEILD